MYKVFNFDTMVENMLELEKCYYESNQEEFTPFKYTRKYL